MNLQDVRNAIPDFGRDIRLNLESVLTLEGAPGLTDAQIGAVALACAYALNAPKLVAALRGRLDAATEEASRAAATIMAMNNVYYRTQHLIDDEALKKLPARLRMSVIGKPGVDKVTFELMCFAVSALAGCGQCLKAHLQQLREAGVSDEGVQSSVRIASVLAAAERALAIAAMEA